MNEEEIQADRRRSSETFSKRLFSQAPRCNRSDGRGSLTRRPAKSHLMILRREMRSLMTFAVTTASHQGYVQLGGSASH
jgi:hypothetical protein